MVRALERVAGGTARAALLRDHGHGGHRAPCGLAGVGADALRLSKQGVPDAEMARALLRNPELREVAERMHVVARRGPGGEPGFLVFSRDPLTRERGGGVRCGGGQEREDSFQAAELPRLLSEARVAEGTAP